MRARKLFLFSAALALAVCAQAGAVLGQDATPVVQSTIVPSIDDWGEHGLLQTPSARVGPDGEFSFTYSHVHPYDRYNIFLTPLPWLDAGFRYTDITDRPYGPTSFSGNQSYKDRSFDIKLRLWPESASFPETALGIRDIAGTGLFSSEYLVTSRRYYDFDVSLGLGWGLMSSGLSLPNIFGVFGQSFRHRAPSTGAGNFTFDYFHGQKMALFGGIEYHTPIEGLRLKLELDPNDYLNEPLNNQFHALLPINLGIVYRPYSFLELSAGLERGNTLMLRTSLLANFNSLGLYHDDTKPPRLVPRPLPPAPLGVPFAESTLPRVATAVPALPAAQARPSAATDIDRLFAGASRLGYDITDVSINGDRATLTVAPSPHLAPDALPALRRLAVANLRGVRRVAIIRQAAPPLAPDLRLRTVSAAPSHEEAAVAQRVFADLRAIGFTGERFSLRGERAWLTFSQQRYRLIPIAIGRAARIVARDAPPEVEEITLDIAEDGVAMASVTLLRRDLERAVADEGSPEEIWAHTTLAGADPGRPPGVVNENAYPMFRWSLNPSMKQELGGPDNFIIYEIYAALSGTLKPAPGWSFDGILGANLFNNLNAIHQTSNSLLPHVRSDINKYLKEGKTGIYRLQSDYMFNIAPDLYGRVSGGILEEMFSGVDGEVLYRPYGERWAVGLDLNHVYQRDYDELLGLRSYQVTTGHLSLYYKFPFYNLEGAVHIGRYLAGDKGATFELSREFAGGIRAGIFFTRTNISAQQFGEGSFDKGFMISIPIDVFFGEPSRVFASYLFRPLTRDGGQMLGIAHPLYQETDGYDPARLSRMWPHLLQ